MIARDTYLMDRRERVHHADGGSHPASVSELCVACVAGLELAEVAR